MPNPDIDVVIAGGGPVGVAAAHLLGTYGIRTIVFERDTAPYTYPRVAGVDEEALRVFQAMDLAEPLLKEMRPLRPALQLVGRGRRVLFTMHRPGQPYGFPATVTILQHRVEETLRAELSRYPHVDFRTGQRVERFEQDADGVTVFVHGGGEIQQVRARYLLACDGAQSTVRRLCGMTLLGATAIEAWLIIEMKMSGTHASTIRMFGSAERAIASVPLPGALHRWELRLRPDEDAARMESLSPAEVQALLTEIVGDHEMGEIVRQRVYKHHTRMAERFQAGRVFLLGDAAHLMPPFSGQGLCSGLRDASNLCWKLSAVLHGLVAPRVLESYEVERRQHAVATMESAARFGRLLFPGSRLTEWLRDGVVAALMSIAPVRRMITEGKFVKPSPVTGSGLLVGRAPAGALFIQPPVRSAEKEAVLLDHVLGRGFAWIARSSNPRTILPTTAREFWDRLGTRYVEFLPTGAPMPSPPGPDEVRFVEDIEGSLGAWFTAHKVDAVLVRPDRYVAAACRTADLPRVATQAAALLAPLEIQRGALGP